MSQQLTLSARPLEATLEQSLREWVSNAPYLGVALALHLLVLLAFLNLQVELPELDVGQIVHASVPPEPAEVITIPALVVPPEVSDPTATFSEDPLPTDLSAESTLLPNDMPPSHALSASVDRHGDYKAVVKDGLRYLEGHPGQRRQHGVSQEQPRHLRSHHRDPGAL